MKYAGEDCSRIPPQNSTLAVRPALGGDNQVVFVHRLEPLASRLLFQVVNANGAHTSDSSLSYCARNQIYHARIESRNAGMINSIVSYVQEIIQ
jgi:hypothetical protein